MSVLKTILGIIFVASGVFLFAAKMIGFTDIPWWFFLPWSPVVFILFGAILASIATIFAIMFDLDEEQYIYKLRQKEK